MLLVKGTEEMAFQPVVTAVLLHHSAMDILTEGNVCCMHAITYPYMHTQVSVHAYTKCTCIFIYSIVLLSACITVYPLRVVYTCVAPGRRHVIRTCRESA